jgi:hypothetical protein
VVCEVSALCADLRVRVKRGAETCEALLPWHGEAVGLRVDDDPDWVRVPGDRTKAFRVRAVDDRGRTVRSWNGPVRIKVAGAARLRSWRADDLLEVRGGEARGFCDVQDCEDHPEVEATWVQQ